MHRNNIYHTKQKDCIIDNIKKYNREFTIKELYTSMNKKVGLTTIYRLVDKLVSDGKLIKNITDDNITYYTYLEECNCLNHFYLKCNKCNRLIHIDCDCISDLTSHIKKEHNFKLDNNVIIAGICYECINKETINNG